MTKIQNLQIGMFFLYENQLCVLVGHYPDTNKYVCYKFKNSSAIRLSILDAQEAIERVFEPDIEGGHLEKTNLRSVTPIELQLREDDFFSYMCLVGSTSHILCKWRKRDNYFFDNTFNNPVDRNSRFVSYLTGTRRYRS